ncbi:hypothetical protein JAAARDRAFT_187389 [Jaapia argillacea MUCL 33604]|uniref:Uncharacterized protein n=1 Tax=Jaapia argillacea MUCL 33604 TaxID=933084 RepID=A0A067QAN6_9AGAM|nr:hypothetical protein JAAARDRAFT_187389 [Jaapia argillacea MUCL 33604]
MSDEDLDTLVQTYKHLKPESGDMRLLRWTEHGVYIDDCDGLHPETIHQYYGHHSQERVRLPHQSGAGHPEDEEDADEGVDEELDMEGELQQQIGNNQQHNIRHEPIDVLESNSPFEMEEYHDAFFNALSQVRDAGLVPDDFGLHPHEWEGGDVGPGLGKGGSSKRDPASHLVVARCETEEGRMREASTGSSKTKGKGKSAKVSEKRKHVSRIIVICGGFVIDSDDSDPSGEDDDNDNDNESSDVIRLNDQKAPTPGKIQELLDHGLAVLDPDTNGGDDGKSKYYYFTNWTHSDFNAWFRRLFPRLFEYLDTVLRDMEGPKWRLLTKDRVYLDVVMVDKPLVKEFTLHKGRPSASVKDTMAVRIKEQVWRSWKSGGVKKDKGKKRAWWEDEDDSTTQTLEQGASSSLAQCEMSPVFPTIAQIINSMDGHGDGNYSSLFGGSFDEPADIPVASGSGSHFAPGSNSAANVITMADTNATADAATANTTAFAVNAAAATATAHTAANLAPQTDHPLIMDNGGEHLFIDLTTPSPPPPPTLPLPPLETTPVRPAPRRNATYGIEADEGLAGILNPWKRRRV